VDEGRRDNQTGVDIPVIDAHHHLFDRPGRRYLLDEFLTDSAGHQISDTVYVETQAFARIGGPLVLRPLGEVEFANGIGAIGANERYGRCHVAAAIVGYADLTDERVDELLDRSLESAPERFRGIRQLTIEHHNDAPFVHMTHPPRAGLLRSAEFARGFRHLAPRGLSFDAAVFHPQLPDLAAIADANPDTTIVLNHLGIAMAMDCDDAGRDAVFLEWRKNLRDLARRPNVMCKITGLALPYWGFKFEMRSEAPTAAELIKAWRPYVETAIEAFTPDRCLIGSNFPNDGTVCDYTTLWSVYKAIIRDYSKDEQWSLLHDAAARIYRI
jgi:L-fuconolactonase